MPWEKTPAILRYVQFPWRLLIFSASFGAGAAAMASPIIDRWIHPAILTGLAVIFAISTLLMTLMPQVIKKMSPEQLVKWNHRWERKGLYGGSAIQGSLPKWVHGDYLKPEFLDKNPVPENRLPVTSKDLVCNGYTHQGTSYEYSYAASADSEARIAVFYWPGWELRVDSKLQPGNATLDSDGLVNIKLPAGSHHAQLRYNLSPQGKSVRAFSIVAAVIWISIVAARIFRAWRTSDAAWIYLAQRSRR